MSLARVIAKHATPYIGPGGTFTESDQAWGGRQFDYYTTYHIVMNGVDAALLAGPDEGYLRIYSSINFTNLGGGVDSNMALRIDVEDDPESPYYIGTGMLALLNGVTSDVPALRNRLIPIGFGESMIVENTDPAAITSVVAIYTDIPRYNIALLRKKLSEVPVQIFPAAPNGYFYKFLNVYDNNPAVNIHNNDSVSHKIMLYSGGLTPSDLLINREGIPAGESGLVPGLSYLDNTFTAVTSVALGEVLTDGVPVLFGAYDKFQYSSYVG